MNLLGLSVSAPGEPLYIELFKLIGGQKNVTDLNAAVAYATLNGAEALHKHMNVADRKAWERYHKRWLVAIDWCRSEPIALEFLQSLPNSEVRIFNGRNVVRRPNCTPARSFHPKAFMFSGQSVVAFVFGSGNLSWNGLRRGVEVGGTVIATGPPEVAASDTWQICQEAKRKLEGLWRGADKLGDVLDDYRKVYKKREELGRPAITDDDEAPTERVLQGRRAISTVLLRQLRACNNLWIEAGNLHKNRGPDKPGNQLMMSPMTRVFFGFLAEDLSRDSYIGDVRIRYDSRKRDDCSLRFSNNSMDVLTLPVPGSEGPDAYDNKVLLFSETFDSVGRVFDLSVGTSSSVAKWREQSNRIDATVSMSSGRRWGVF